MNKKRLFSIILALCLLLTTLAAPGFAAESEPTLAQKAEVLKAANGGAYSTSDEPMTMAELNEMLINAYGLNADYVKAVGDADPNTPDSAFFDFGGGGDPKMPFMRGNLAYVMVKLYELSAHPIDSPRSWAHLDQSGYQDVDVPDRGYPGNKEAIYLCKKLGVDIPEKSLTELGFEMPVTKADFTAAAYSAMQKQMHFSDVKAGDPHYTAIKFVYCSQITTGLGDGRFGPAEPVTRGQFITMLCRAYGIPEAAGDNFADAGSTWYTGYLAAVKQRGISNGVGDNQFAPEKIVTLEEMYTLAYNALLELHAFPGPGKAQDLSAFSDSASVSPWAQTAVKTFAELGVLVEIDGKLTPRAAAQRAVMAQLFYNMIGA